MPVGQTVTHRKQSTQSPVSAASSPFRSRPLGSPRFQSYVTVIVCGSINDDITRPYGHASTQACSRKRANTP